MVEEQKQINELPNKTPKSTKRRTLFSIMNIIGKQCKVRTIDNKTIIGVVFSLTRSGIVAFDCKINKKPIGHYCFNFTEIISIETKTTLVTHRNFKTDTQISKKRQEKPKQLVKWESEDTGEEIELRGSTSWDQFKVNQEKFGVKSTYDETLYTTKRVKEEELTQKQLEQARQIAAELGETNEEPEEEEEARYAAVIGSGRYRKNSDYSLPVSETKNEYKQLRNALMNPRGSARRSSFLYSDSIAALDPMINYKPLDPKAEEKLEKFKKEREYVKRLDTIEDLREFAKKIPRKDSEAFSMNPNVSDFKPRTQPSPPPESLIDHYTALWKSYSELKYLSWVGT